MSEAFPAEIELFSSELGGLKEPMPLPTKSLILVFASLDKDSSDDVMIGACISSGDRGSMAPGDQLHAIVEFWAGVGRVYATDETQFKLWYAGRIVGSGRFDLGDMRGGGE